MLEFIKSRGFWTLILGITPPVLALFDLTDDKKAAILAVIGALAGYFGVTAARAWRGAPTSYKKALDRR